jgi:hypothetical protein
MKKLYIIVHQLREFLLQNRNILKEKIEHTENLIAASADRTSQEAIEEIAEHLKVTLKGRYYRLKRANVSLPRKKLRVVRHLTGASMIIDGDITEYSLGYQLVLGLIGANELSSPDFKLYI